MEYRNLGRAGVQVSTICLGAMTFGEPTEGSFMHGVAAPEDEAFAMMDRALDQGVNFVDTADVYGSDGLSERVIGKWFERTGCRRDVVLATKCRFRMSPGVLGSGSSRRRIVFACEQSLKRLKTDYIDLYQIHQQDKNTPEDEVLRALDDLVSAGKVHYVGCSNYAAYRLVESDWTADKRNLTPYATFQAQYSLSIRSLEREHIPYMKRSGMGLLPWSPLAGGLLTGKYRKGELAPTGTRMASWTDAMKRFDTDRNWRIVDALRSVADELSTSCAAVALAWVRDRPTVTSVIIGARNCAQLDDNLRGAHLVLPPELRQRLDDVSALTLDYPYDFIAGNDGTW
ncbi:MAG: aldo/keto reductase [Myxococcales bacterium]|nr:aldo/keto reductase [Myxococcales bacterium]